MLSPLEKIIYNEILKIPLAQVSQYFSPYDRLIHLLLIPSIVLIVFLYGATSFLSGKKGLRFLVAIGAMIFGLSIGFYPVLITMSEIWYLILLIVSGFFFIVGRIIHPSDVRKLTANLGPNKDKIIARINAIDSQLNILGQELSIKQNSLKNAENNLVMARSRVAIRQLTKEINDLNAEIKRISDSIDRLSKERARLLRRI